MRRNRLSGTFTVCLLIIFLAVTAGMIPAMAVFCDELLEVEMFDESFADDTDESAALSEEAFESDPALSESETENSGDMQAADASSREKAAKGTVFDADGLIEDPSGNKIDENLVFEITDEAVRGTCAGACTPMDIPMHPEPFLPPSLPPAADCSLW